MRGRSLRVVAALDYLVASRLGVVAEPAALRVLAGGAWDLADFGTADLSAALAVVEQYADQVVGLADASNVALAGHHQTRTIATLDHRHLNVLRPLGGARFTILP